MEINLRKDIFTISDIEKMYNIPRQTLHSRFKKLTEMKFLQEDNDYRNFGMRLPIIFTETGVKKLISNNRVMF